MKKNDFSKRLENEILILDGAMGTMLQPHMDGGSCYEMANLENPDLVKKVHAAYADAGADIINTNTFGGSRIKLNEFKAGHYVEKINIRSAQIAREAVRPGVLIAGNIGPTGKMTEPAGDLSFQEAFDGFREQAAALQKGGVDLFNLETFSDLKEIRIAMMAIRSISDLPVMASMSYEENSLTFTGTDPETAANVLTSLGADVLGVNCSTGPEPMLDILGRYLLSTHLPLFVEPNAGIPSVNQKKTIYQIPPEIMAEFANRFVMLGANIVGSCCGSTPEYTAALKSAVKSKKPVSKIHFPGLRLSSRTRTVLIHESAPFGIIGERINPTNREDLNQALRSGQTGLFRKEAQHQAEEGAHLLDVNIGVPGLDEAAMMGKVIRGIENVVQTPLVIDSTHPEAIEAALQETPGKVLINSVHGSEESLARIIPLAAKYGTGLLCLAVGEKGIPKTAVERLNVLKEIIRAAEKAGIPREHLICDCLTLTVSAEQKRVETTLAAIRMVKEELGLPAVLGLSNISFGLPDRGVINAAFLSMAMAAGLDAAIMNTGDPFLMKTVRAASVLTVRDKDSRLYVAAHKNSTQPKNRPVKKAGGPTEHPVYRAVITGDTDGIRDIVQNSLKELTPLQINTLHLIPAIQEVGRRYERKELFLPQMILSAEAMQKAFSVIEPLFGHGDLKSAGKVLLCTVKGDVHDIGKNIVGLFLKNEGFEVVDLGKDIPAETILEEARLRNADVIGLSALMTTTMTQMPEIINALKKSGSAAKTIVGGAVVTQAYADEIGSDGFAKDALQAVQVIRQLVIKPS